MVVVVAVLLVAGVVVAATAALRSPCTVTPVRCTMAPRLSFCYASLAGWRTDFPVAVCSFVHRSLVRSALAWFVCSFARSHFPASRMHAGPRTSLGLLARSRLATLLLTSPFSTSLPTPLPLAHLLPCLLPRLLACLLLRQLACPTHLPIHLLPYSLTHSLVHSLTRLFTHSLTPPTR